MVTLAEVTQFIDAQKETKEVQTYLAGFKTPVTPESVSAFLETDEGKKVIQPRIDQHFSKGLETWKEKSLPKILEDEILKRFPQETQEQKRIRLLEEDVSKEKSARVKAELQKKALTYATQKNLPVELVDFVLGTDEATTDANLANVEKIWNEKLKLAVEAIFKSNGRAPVKDDSTPPDIDAQIAKAESDKDWKKAMSLKSLKLSKNSK